MTTKLKHTSKIVYENKKLYSLVLKGMKEILDFGWDVGSLYEEQCYYIEIDKLPVAYITYYPIASSTTMWIHLLYVEPEFRKKGFAKKLIKKVIDISKKDKEILNIGCGIHKDNISSLSVFKSTGFNDEYIYKYLKIKD